MTPFLGAPVPFLLSHQHGPIAKFGSCLLTLLLCPYCPPPLAHPVTLCLRHHQDQPTREAAHLSRREVLSLHMPVPQLGQQHPRHSGGTPQKCVLKGGVSHQHWATHRLPLAALARTHELHLTRVTLLSQARHFLFLCLIG